MDIRSRRQELGLSMRELADRAGCHRLTIWRAEHGQGTPRGSTLRAIERALAAETNEVRVYLPNGSYGVMRFEDFERLYRQK
jgi:transcriptional regulator with XRE-family HTH domain